MGADTVVGGVVCLSVCTREFVQHPPVRVRVCVSCASMGHQKCPHSNISLKFRRLNSLHRETGMIFITPEFQITPTRDTPCVQRMARGMASSPTPTAPAPSPPSDTFPSPPSLSPRPSRSLLRLSHPCRSSHTCRRPPPPSRQVPGAYPIPVLGAHRDFSFLLFFILCILSCFHYFLFFIASIIFFHPHI